ncbi:MAG: efflux RND transporter periplasmic adaptor subunit [Bacteroidetes bacterium]|nr:efflux RND transporter periplasmic adaptor subunit [Bacteroidota bacterium]
MKLKIKNKKKFYRYLIIGGVALVIILGIGKKKGWFGKNEMISVSTEIVTKRTIIETVSANGKVQPEVEVKISPDVSGEVTELYVKEGDEVKKGDLLAKINPDIYMSNLDRMVATLNTSKANMMNSQARLIQIEAQYTNAKASFERNEKLWKQQAISASEFDAAKAAFEVAKADVEAGKQTVKAAEYGVKSTAASLKEASDNLTKTSIFAPVSGTISKLSVEKGERVVGTSQFAGTEIMRIANLNEMEVNVSVNENDIVRVHLGDTALIEVDAYLNRKFKGIVTEMANSANTTGTSADQVTNFEVKIRILRESYLDLVSTKNPNLSPFRPGMSATVDIQTKTVYNVLTVPIQAVTTRDDTTNVMDKKPMNEEGNGDENASTEKKKDEKKKSSEMKEYVFMYVDGKVKMQKVKTGIQDNTYIQILEGLKEKQEIIAAPYRAISKQLKNGDAVKKVDKKELFTTSDEK